MVRESIVDAALGLLWNAWAELGVPGAERKLQRVAVDPDPLIVFTPALASEDPRLLEQAATWCERHGDTVAKTRLWGLARSVPPDVCTAFTGFVEPLGGAAGSWKPVRVAGQRAGSVTAAAPLPHHRSTPPPLQRPALARLRMRALAGTGARADVLCELLALPPGGWTSATNLERLGYTRRSVARVLADLAAAGIASERSEKAPASFRLREPRSLITLVAAEDLKWPDWSAVLSLAWRLVQLERSAHTSAGLAQVRAHDAWAELRRLSLATGSSEPPAASGDPAAWPSLIAWGSTALREWPFDSHVTR